MESPSTLQMSNKHTPVAQGLCACEMESGVNRWKGKKRLDMIINLHVSWKILFFRIYRKYASWKHDKILKEAETLIQRCFDVNVMSLSSLKWWWLMGVFINTEETIGDWEMLKK